MFHFHRSGSLLLRSQAPSELDFDSWLQGQLKTRIVGGDNITWSCREEFQQLALLHLEWINQSIGQVLFPLNAITLTRLFNSISDPAVYVPLLMFIVIKAIVIHFDCDY